jgi:hypothetical protein
MTSGPWIGSRQKKTGLEGQIGIMESKKEAYKVEADKIIISFHRVELDSKASRVSSLVWELPSKSDGRKPNKDGCFFSDRRKKVGFLRHSQYTLI